MTTRLMKGSITIDVKDAHPLKNIRIWLGEDYLQVEAGHYLDDDDKRTNTYARRVYADEGGAALLALLQELADNIASGHALTLPVWGRGETVPGYREL